MLAAAPAASSNQAGTLWQEASSFKLPAGAAIAACGAGAVGAGAGFSVASSTSRLPVQGLVVSCC
jgi:hypothetical protein